MATPTPPSTPPTHPSQTGLFFQSKEAPCGGSTSQKYQKPLVGCPRVPENMGFTTKGVESGNTLAPWVLIEFSRKGRIGNKISVSNQSSPGTLPPNTAVIQTFEIGWTDGMKGNITIHDIEGGNFVRFAENLITDFQCLNGASTNPKVKIQFGWVKSGCPNSYPTAASECYHGYILGIDTNYAEGKFIAQLEFAGLATFMTEGYVEAVQGTDDQPLCLMDAIEKLLTKDVKPNVAKVRFARVVGAKNGSRLQDCGFKQRCGDEGKDDVGRGPKDKFPPNSKDKMTAVMSWLKSWPTDKDLGWRPWYNPNVEGGEVIFLEDTNPECVDKDTNFFLSKNIGHYIVNGGDASPVLEFSPKIKWNFALLQSSGGSMGNQQTNSFKGVEEGGKSPGRRPCVKLLRPVQKGTGHPMNITDNEVLLNQFAADSVNQGQKGVNKAINAYRLNFGAIAAELVVVGDPTLNPIQTQSRFLAITVINPFHINTEKSGNKDWNITAGNSCNNILSNPGWMVKHVTHKIELGKYTTHFSLTLAAPGSMNGDTDQHAGLWAPIGGTWSNGWTPANCS